MSGKTLGESWNNTADQYNHLNGWGYDGTGNLNAGVNGNAVNIFNGENQWIQQTHYNVTYGYDGDGHRVEASGGSLGTRLYWYDESGNVLSELDQNGATKSNYIYLNGQRIAQISGGMTNYYLVDHLGTTRKIINQAGTLCYDADFYPWGDEQQVYVNNCLQNYKFTGKERDPDMGIVYFGARFYQDPIARFYTPDWSADPEPVPYAKLDHPQSLNLYTYVHNNPVCYTDLNGHGDAPATAVFAQAFRNLFSIKTESGAAAKVSGSLGGVKVGGGSGVTTETKYYPFGDKKTEITTKSESTIEAKIGPVKAELKNAAPYVDGETGKMSSSGFSGDVGTAESTPVGLR